MKKRQRKTSHTPQIIAITLIIICFVVVGLYFIRDNDVTNKVSISNKIQSNISFAVIENQQVENIKEDSTQGAKKSHKSSMSASKTSSLEKAIADLTNLTETE